MEPCLQQYCQRQIQEYISWNMDRRKPGKSITGMMLFSLLSVQDSNILPKWYEETTGLCTYYLNPPAAIFIYGWRYQGRHNCAYANGLPCLFRLRAPTFTLQRKLLHPCVIFWETSYKNALQQVLCKLWFFITYPPLSLLESTDSETMLI